MTTSKHIAADLFTPGTVNFVLGGPGAGKGLFWCWYAAYLTTGDAPRDVLIADRFDKPQHVASRLGAAGADLSRIRMMERAAVPQLTADALDDYLSSTSVDAALGLVIVDPWDRQEPVDKWAALAARHGLVVLLTEHTGVVESVDIDAAGSALSLTRDGCLGDSRRTLAVSGRDRRIWIEFEISGADYRGRMDVVTAFKLRPFSEVPRSSTATDKDN